MAGKNFYVWATLISDRAANELVVGLVRRGFQVEPLADDNTLTNVGEVSVLCALNVIADHVPATLPEGRGPQHWVLDRVTEVLDETKNAYYSLIIFEIGGTCTWIGSNIKLPKKVADEPPAVKDDEPPTAIDKMDRALG
jgi:hypothetical protein